MVAWLLLAGVSAWLSDVQLHQTAVTSARIRAILHHSGEDPTP
jgi:hypothetical protein